VSPDTARRPAAAGGVVALASFAAAVVPIAVAAVRAATSGWFPIGDDAFFALRARDVLTTHHPLLGTWTSASLTVGTDLNNPGPLLFDLLAVPAKVDAAGGLAVGVALVNIACVAGIAAFAWRRAGAAGVALAMSASAGLAWTMGSELLFSPWQPHALLFPFLCLVFAVWSLAAGDAAALPWAVLLASLLVQSHLSYALLVPALAGAGCVALGWSARRSGSGRSLVRPVLVALVVGVACWAQPLVDQVTGEGNLTTLAGNASSGSAKVGAALGTRLAAWVLAVPPFWTRPSFRSALYVPGPDLPPTVALALVGLVALAGVLAVAGIVDRRRHADRDGLPAAVVALVALGAAWATTAVLPVGLLGVVPHQFTWLWPVGVFASFAIARGLVPERVALVGGLVATLVLAVAALPSWNARSGPSADAGSIATAKALAARLDVGGADAVWFDPSGLRFAEPYSTVVLLELQRRGVEVRVTDAVLARQVGGSRRVSASAATRLPRLIEREGDAAVTTPAGASVAARVRALDGDEKAELDALEDEVGAFIAEHGIRLNERGRRFQRGNGLPALRTAGTVLRDPAQLLGTAELNRIITDDLAAGIPPAWQPKLARYAELREAWNVRTVAIYRFPPEAS
jgi:hypothetical protein